ncbi:hypothetical protein PBOI14_76570 [Pseudomonas sp. Boi14]|nr:hypothetical protein PBOI14_76570 [Pseudomonas sp. Boi14]
MYLPRAFVDEDLARLQQLILGSRLATLVTWGALGLQASHLPLLLDPGQGPMAPSTGTWPRPTRNAPNWPLAPRRW